MKGSAHVAGVCALGLLVAGCGGGGGGSASDNDAAPTSLTSSGTVTGFGSVFVNGVKWETSGTSFEIDDDVGSEGDLEVGQIVLVRGTVSADGTATATSIERDAEVEGPITAIDLSTDTIMVLAQRILITNETVFEAEVATSIDGLAVGDFVEVDAHRLADGILRAVRIEVKAEPDDFEVSGQVSNLDTTTSTFNLGDLTVDFASAILKDFGDHLLADGDHVEVEGTQIGIDGELIAIKVELEDDNPYDDAEEFQIEGVISAVNPDGSFQLAGMTVLQSDAVQFEHGDSSDLAVGVRVEVEGYVDGSGQLIATEIEIEHEANIEVFAPVQAVDPTAGTLSVLGIDFMTRDTTRFDDDSSLAVRFFSLVDVAPGDWVEIEAFEDQSTGAIIAVSIERDDAEGDMVVEIEGPVDSVGTDQLVLVGVTATLDASTTLGDDAGVATIADFLASLMPGTIVEVEGIQSGTSAVTAIEIDLED